MAASSERSPPPFPESEEQELEPDLEEDEEDSEEGADIFTGGVSTVRVAEREPCCSGAGRVHGAVTLAEALNFKLELLSVCLSLSLSLFLLPSTFTAASAAC